MNNEKPHCSQKIYLYRCIPNQLYTFLKAIVKLGVRRLGVAFHQSNRIKAGYQFSFQTPNYTPEKTTRRMHQQIQTSSVYNPYLPR